MNGCNNGQRLTEGVEKEKCMVEELKIGRQGCYLGKEPRTERRVGKMKKAAVRGVMEKGKPEKERKGWCVARGRNQGPRREMAENA